MEDSEVIFFPGESNQGHEASEENLKLDFNNNKKKYLTDFH